MKVGQSGIRGRGLATRPSAGISTVTIHHSGAKEETTRASKVRRGAPPCSSPLSLCTGRSLCPTGWEPAPPCTPGWAPAEAASPAPAFYTCPAGSGRI